MNFGPEDALERKVKLLKNEIFFSVKSSFYWLFLSFKIAWHLKLHPFFFVFQSSSSASTLLFVNFFSRFILSLFTSCDDEWEYFSFLSNESNLESFWWHKMDHEQRALPSQHPPPPDHYDRKEMKTVEPRMKMTTTKKTFPSLTPLAGWLAFIRR